jgi:DNA replication protein DnaC
MSDDLESNLKYLKLPFMREHHHTVFCPLAQQAAADGWSHEDYLEKLADGEAALRKDRSTQRRIRLALSTWGPSFSRTSGWRR